MTIDEVIAELNKCREACGGDAEVIMDASEHLFRVDAVEAGVHWLPSVAIIKIEAQDSFLDNMLRNNRG